MWEKIWKPILILVLIIACLLNLIVKLVRTVNFKDNLQNTVNTKIEEKEVNNE